MLKSIAILGILLSALSTNPETFEEYQNAQKQGLKAQSQEFKEYEKASAREFAEYQKEQKQALQQWVSEYEAASRSGLRRILLPDTSGKSRNAMYDMDYTESRIRVKALGAGTTPDQAVKSAQKSAQKTLREAWSKGDPSLNLSEKALRQIESAPLSTDTFTIRKSGKGYMAEVMTEQSFKAALPAAVESQSSRSAPPSKAAVTSYTSLIVDARGLGFKACLVPVLENNAGEQLYGPKWVNKESAVNGMAVWTSDIEAAKNAAKAGGKPLIVKAAAVRDQRYLKFNGKSAETLALLINSDIVRQCKVIIVVD